MRVWNRSFWKYLPALRAFGHIRRMRLFPGLIGALALSMSAVYSQPPQNIRPVIAKAKPGLIRSFTTINYDNGPLAFSFSSLVFDDLYAYAATPGGLFRASLPLTPRSPFALIAFPN